LGGQEKVSDLQDLIATQSIRAFNMGMDHERERIIKLLKENGFIIASELVKEQKIKEPVNA
jgi:hypothetical protein